MRSLTQAFGDARRFVMQVTPVADGFQVRLSCDHESLWADPPLLESQVTCTDCLDRHLEELRTGRQA